MSVISTNIDSLHIFIKQLQVSNVNISLNILNDMPEMNSTISVRQSTCNENSFAMFLFNVLTFFTFFFFIILFHILLAILFIILFILTFHILLAILPTILFAILFTMFRFTFLNFLDFPAFFSFLRHILCNPEGFLKFA